MKLYYLAMVGVCATFLVFAARSSLAANAKEANLLDAYHFTFTTLIGQKPMPLSQFKGKVLLIVNTASQCGFTGQYEPLEKLYERFKGRGLVIIGVPSNDFGEQEPGTNEQIASFCKLNYGVSFPMAAKEHVSGDAAHPFYRWAKNTLGFGTAPKWNFHKYLVDRQGTLVDYFNSTTAPDNDRIITEIERLLAEPE